MIELLKARRVELEAWRERNMDKLGTPEFRRATIAHRLLCDLIAFDGGTPEQRAYVARAIVS